MYAGYPFGNNMEISKLRIMLNVLVLTLFLFDELFIMSSLVTGRSKILLARRVLRSLSSVGTSICNLYFLILVGKFHLLLLYFDLNKYCGRY